MAKTASTTNSSNTIFVTCVGTTSANGLYRAGDIITIQVDYKSAVQVSGTPMLELNSGGTAEFSGYGANATVLQFTYVVQPGDEAADLNVVGYGPGSGSVQGPSGKPTSFTGSTSLSTNADLRVDAQGPTVASITSDSVNGTYEAGDAIDITVQFGEAVVVTAVPA